MRSRMGIVFNIKCKILRLSNVLFINTEFTVTRWVQYEEILSACLVGRLHTEHTTTTAAGAQLDDDKQRPLAFCK